ncbi:leucine-rich repeat domain-containing protein [Rickettsia endosymbiont of Orchestes rusci]|uniref:hypothetical protein n=1 Tax=Rickettsia endosymbiont of Orchestes rusci TaxID=3066250 RepID=UPI00313EFC03
MNRLIEFLRQKGFTEEAANLKNGSDILKLTEKNITDTDVKEISELLAEDTNIIQLDLFGNKISSDGAIAIAKLLKINKTITSLDLGNNNIGKTGASEFERVLKANTTLIFLNLAWNPVEAAEYKNIKKYLVRNANLTNEQEIVKIAKSFNEIDEDKLLKKLDIL